MMMTMTTMSQSTAPKTNAAAVIGVSVGVGVGDAVGTGVGFTVGTGVGFAVGTGVGTAVGTGVGVGVGAGFTVTETALDAGEVTGVEALSVTVQVTECEVPAAV